MGNLRKAMNKLNLGLNQHQQEPAISFEEFVKLMSSEPTRVFRNVFQVFHDMMKFYVSEGTDEYPDDPESIHFVNYDCNKLFVEGSDRPFFADRLFANRLISHVEALLLGAQQNKIYIFEGPHGSGKSTLLNNLLLKFEEYANSRKGQRYEVVWRVNKKMLGRMERYESNPLVEMLLKALGNPNPEQDGEDEILQSDDNFFEISCPSHDNPILMIPKSYRRQFFDDVFENDEFKWKLFTAKEYEWVFRDDPCTICKSLFQALLNKYNSPLRVMSMIYARPFHFN
jgi:hypothetical protein